MRTRLLTVRRCLQIYVCLASVQIAYASRKREPGSKPDNGQAIAQGKVAATDGSGSQGVATGAVQSMSQSNAQGVGLGAAGQSNDIDQALGQVVGQGDAAVQTDAIQADRDTSAIQTIRLDSSASSAAVGVTPPNNAVMPVTGPPNHAVVPVTGPPNHAVVPVAGPASIGGAVGGSSMATGGITGETGFSQGVSPTGPSNAASCSSCQCNCPASFGVMVNQAVMMEAMLAPAQSTMVTVASSVTVAQNNMQNAALPQTAAPASSAQTTAAAAISTLSSLPAPSTVSTSAASSAARASSPVLSSPAASSSIPPASIPLPKVTAQNNIAQGVATPRASTAQAVTAGAAPVPIVSDISTFQFQSAVTVPLKIRRAKPTSAVG